MATSPQPRKPRPSQGWPPPNEDVRGPGGRTPDELLPSPGPDMPDLGPTSPNRPQPLPE